MRGGARAGAGRKAVLSWKQRIHIGAECDNYQREQRIGKAMARFDKQPAQVALKAARENLKGKTAKGVARLVKTEIAPLVRAVGGAVRVPLRREKTR